MDPHNKGQLKLKLKLVTLVFVSWNGRWFSTLRMDINLFLSNASYLCFVCKGDVNKTS